MWNHLISKQVFANIVLQVDAGNSELVTVLFFSLLLLKKISWIDSIVPSLKGSTFIWKD